jgi:hypothetical protein
MFGLDKTLQIKCKAYTTVELDELNDLYDTDGKFKISYANEVESLKKSLIDKGFRFPVFMWIDPEGKKWIVDAHRRKLTLKIMRDEGWNIPPLPAAIIEAKDKKEAKELLLLQESKYGHIQQEGIGEYMSEVGAEITPAEVMPYIQIDEFTEIYGPEEPNEAGDSAGAAPIRIECPNCHHIDKQAEFKKVKDETV